MRKIFITLVLFSFIAQLGIAQSRKVYEQAAKDALAAQDYSAALGYYEILIDQAEYEDLENYYNAGEAAYNFNHFQRSERYFQWAIDNGGRDQFSTLDYQMAMTKKRLGKYAEAKELFEKYIEEHPSSTNGFPEKAADQVDACDWALSLVEQPEINVHGPLAVSDLEIVEHLDTTINTKYTDLAPLEREGTLYYSSVRYFAGTEAAPFARILSSKDGEQAQPVDGLGGAGNLYVAHTAFNADASRIYFTQCDTAGTRYHCSIYYRDREGNSWGSAVALDDNINKKVATATQPSVGVDQQTGQAYLFFVSDRKGGQGGLDIWCSIIGNDGSVGAPYNVSAVNTRGDDITPYFHGKKNTLYFSSNGRQSMGGFDIYKSEKSGSKWSMPAHTGYPLNSSYDDVYMSLNEKGDVAHLSSNRPGGICKDTAAFECICDDIYSVNVPFIDLIVETYNKITGEQLTQSLVSLQAGNNQAANQGPGEEYRYFYDLDFNEDYEVKGTKEGYLPDSETFDTRQSQESGTLVKKLYLTPEVEVLAKTYDKVTGSALLGTTVKLIEAPTATLDTKTDPNGYSHEYPLEFKKRYWLIATKEGYLPDTVEVSTENIPVIPTYLKENLFLCRKPFDDNPQIVLFFDNDIPKKVRSNHALTNSNYQETVEQYLSTQKTSEYLSAFDNAEDRQKVQNFFSEVDVNYSRLKSFANNLYQFLKAPGVTDTVVITIKGYASPLAKPAYNKLLTERRIYSIEKYFREYQGGILIPYLGQVKVQREPYGEAEAVGGSEDRRNKKASIYSIDASRERRVEIINISSSLAKCPKDNPTPKDQN